MKENLQAEVTRLRERLALEDRPKSSEHQWVQNADSEVIHLILVADLAVPAPARRTGCGWKFWTKRFRMCTGPGACAKLICEICASEEKLLAEG